MFTKLVIFSGPFESPVPVVSEPISEDFDAHTLCMRRANSVYAPSDPSLIDTIFACEKNPNKVFKIRVLRQAGFGPLISPGNSTGDQPLPATPWSIRYLTTHAILSAVPKPRYASTAAVWHRRSYFCRLIERGRSQAFLGRAAEPQ